MAGNDPNFRITLQRNNIGLLAEAAGARFRLVLRKVAHDIEGEAKTRAPFKTGFLRNSIGNRLVNQYQAEVTVTAEYAAYLEFGTRRMAARPFFTPAVEHNRAPFEAAVAQVLRDAADDARAE